MKSGAYKHAVKTVKTHSFPQFHRFRIADGGAVKTVITSLELSPFHRSGCAHVLAGSATA